MSRAANSHNVALDRKSTRLTPVTVSHLVCRLLLEKGELPADVLLDNAFNFAREQAGRPFFIYVCLMDVNRDYYETALDSPAWQRAVPHARLVSSYDPRPSE